MRLRKLVFISVAQWISGWHFRLIVRRSWVWYPAGAGLFGVEFACPPHVCVGSLWVLWLPSTDQRHAGKLVSLKTAHRCECERERLSVSLVTSTLLCLECKTHQFFCLSLASLLIWRLSGAKTEQFGNAAAPVLCWKVWGCILMWTGGYKVRGNAILFGKN